ncbi:MAG: CpcT/CpeT family chromophore lyase [Planctomycetota bacterium]
MKLNALVAATVLALTGSAGLAQDMNAAAPEPQANPWPAYNASWSEPVFAQIATAMAGTWRTSNPVRSSGGDEVNLVVNIHAVPVEGMTDTVYMETFRADNMSDPARQVIGQLYRHTGENEVRFRTFEIKMTDKSIGVLTGLGALPQAFPTVTADDLIATLDLAFTSTDGTIRAQTEHAYPTGLGGAVEMTSAIEFNGNTMRTMDRGFGPTGAQVWGPAQGQAYQFSRTDNPFFVTDFGDGLVALDLVAGEGEPVADGDILYAHYYGWLRSGEGFDNSYDRGQPFPVAYPPRLIEGWNRGLFGSRTGMYRKLLIPSPLAYGQAGRPGIPPNSPLYFTIEVVTIDRAPEPEAAGAPDPAAGAGGGN